MRFNKLFSLSGVLTIGLLCSSAHADSLLVAAAADLFLPCPRLTGFHRCTSGQ